MTRGGERTHTVSALRRGVREADGKQDEREMNEVWGY